MGLNNIPEKRSKVNQRIPKKELKQIQKLKLQNKELKRQVKSLHKFIKCVKDVTAPIPSLVPLQVEVDEEEDKCPECEGKIKTLSMPRLDGTFNHVSCLECEWRTSFITNS